VPAMEAGDREEEEQVEPLTDEEQQLRS
jgi:hypothetical protein